MTVFEMHAMNFADDRLRTVFSLELHNLAPTLLDLLHKFDLDLLVVEDYFLLH